MRNIVLTVLAVIRRPCLRSNCDTHLGVNSTKDLAWIVAAWRVYCEIVDFMEPRNLQKVAAVLQQLWAQLHRAVWPDYTRHESLDRRPDRKGDVTFHNFTNILLNPTPEKTRLTLLFFIDGRWFGHVIGGSILELKLSTTRAKVPFFYTRTTWIEGVDTDQALRILSRICTFAEGVDWFTVAIYTAV